jgi:hypothetical protein
MAIFHKFGSGTLYQPSYSLPLSICIILFTLYGILGLFDMNKNIHAMTIVELPTISQSSFIYAYVFGYVSFIMRIIVNLITLYVFVLIIMLSFSTIWIIINTKVGKDMTGADITNIWINNTADIIWSVSVYILGIFLTVQFYAIFFFFIPIILAIILQLYSKFIDFPVLKLENEKDMKRIMITHHKIIIFLLVLFFFLGIMAYVFNWSFLI